LIDEWTINANKHNYWIIKEDRVLVINGI